MDQKVIADLATALDHLQQGLRAQRPTAVTTAGNSFMGQVRATQSEDSLFSGFDNLASTTTGTNFGFWRKMNNRKYGKQRRR